jgi:c(7)-type cytochrome triheme protein
MSKKKRLAAVVWFTALVVVGASALLGACSTPGRLTHLVFEQSPPPKPVVRPPRRLPYNPPPPPRKAEPLQERPETNWVALLAQLPKAESGDTDWVQALEMKLIDPKPGIDAAVEDEPVLDLDVELVPQGIPDFKVVFPHRAHTQFLACGNCHTAIFQMQKGADPITMEKVLSGEYCGRCHGKVAFDPATSCARCHVAMPK